MTTQRMDFQSRDAILKLLSDEELARVSNAESELHLMEGDLYIDLEKMQSGVLCADGVLVPMGHILPQKAVHAKTWSSILAKMKGPFND